MPIDINLLRVDAGKWQHLLMNFHGSVMISSSVNRVLICDIGGDPEKVKASERARFRDETIVDQIIEIDNKWRKSKFIPQFDNNFE